MKCQLPILGGAAEELQCQRRRGACCERMRCLQCDFEVRSCAGVRWGDDCDYLFLRNTFPDHRKLKQRLVPAAGSRAYACQCLWVSTASRSPISAHPTVERHWACVP